MTSWNGGPALAWVTQPAERPVVEQEQDERRRDEHRLRRQAERQRERHDADPTQAFAASPEALLEPARQRTRRLEAQPAPRQLDRHRPNPRVARLADPLVAPHRPALVRRRRQSGQRANLASVPKPAPCEELHHQAARAVRPDAEAEPRLREVVNDFLDVIQSN